MYEEILDVNEKIVPGSTYPGRPGQNAYISVYGIRNVYVTHLVPRWTPPCSETGPGGSKIDPACDIVLRELGIDTKD